jgi:hypothetical protein
MDYRKLAVAAVGTVLATGMAIGVSAPASADLGILGDNNSHHSSNDWNHGHDDENLLDDLLGDDDGGDDEGLLEELLGDDDSDEGDDEGLLGGGDDEGDDEDLNLDLDLDLNL